MPEIEERSDSETPYLQHPLYKQAMRHMADGDDAAATEALGRLAELYPEEKDIGDLLLRVELRRTFGSADYIVKEPAPAKPILRNVVVFLLVLTVGLVIVTGLVLVWNHIQHDNEVRQWEARIQSQWAEGRRLIDIGALNEAEQVYAKLEAELGNNEEIANAYRLIEQERAWQNLYTSAVAALERDQFQLTIDLASQVPQESAFYDEAQDLIQKAQDGLDRDAAWQEIQDLVQAGDYDRAIEALEAFRSRYGDYLRLQVEEQLYQLYVLRARPLLDQACGDPDKLRLALEYMRGALRERPANREWIEEERLADDFLKGQEAYDRGDWDEAIQRWEPVYKARRDYQCGVLKTRLDQAYPQAAMQLLAEANGSEKLLTQAIDYMERAKIIEPDNPQWPEEQRLATEYLAGLEAFSQENWNLAIDYWGPIFASRPVYQNGVLERNLRLACANSPRVEEPQCP